MRHNKTWIPSPYESWLIILQWEPSGKYMAEMGMFRDFGDNCGAFDATNSLESTLVRVGSSASGTRPDLAQS